MRISQAYLLGGRKRSLFGLAQRMRALKRNSGKVSNHVKKEYGFQIVKQLALLTPVDTTKAVSNWRVHTRRPGAGAEIEPHYPGIHRVTESLSRMKTITQAAIDVQKVRPRRRLYISNVVDYIVKLNMGTSQQEPAGFVQRAVNTGSRLARLKLKKRG